MNKKIKNFNIILILCAIFTFTLQGCWDDNKGDSQKASKQTTSAEEKKGGGAGGAGGQSMSGTGPGTGQPSGVGFGGLPSKTSGQSQPGGGKTGKFDFPPSPFSQPQAGNQPNLGQGGNKPFDFGAGGFSGQPQAGNQPKVGQGTSQTSGFTFGNLPPLNQQHLGASQPAAGSGGTGFTFNQPKKTNDPLLNATTQDEFVKIFLKNYTMFNPSKSLLELDDKQRGFLQEAILVLVGQYEDSPVYRAKIGNLKTNFSRLIGEKSSDAQEKQNLDALVESLNVILTDAVAKDKPEVIDGFFGEPPQGSEISSLRNVIPELTKETIWNLLNYDKLGFDTHTHALNGEKLRGRLLDLFAAAVENNKGLSFFDDLVQKRSSNYAQELLHYLLLNENLRSSNEVLSGFLCQLIDQANYRDYIKDNMGFYSSLFVDSRCKQGFLDVMQSSASGFSQAATLFDNFLNKAINLEKLTTDGLKKVADAIEMVLEQYKHADAFYDFINKNISAAVTSAISTIISQTYDRNLKIASEKKDIIKELLIHLMSEFDINKSIAVFDGLKQNYYYNVLNDDVIRNHFYTYLEKYNWILNQKTNWFYENILKTNKNIAVFQDILVDKKITNLNYPELSYNLINNFINSIKGEHGDTADYNEVKRSGQYTSGYADAISFLLSKTQPDPQKIFEKEFFKRLLQFFFSIDQRQPLYDCVNNFLTTIPAGQNKEAWKKYISDQYKAIRGPHKGANGLPTYYGVDRNKEDPFFTQGLFSL